MEFRVTCYFLVCLVAVNLAEVFTDQGDYYGGVNTDYYGGPYVPQPYSFGYKIDDKEGRQYREETSDGKGGVRGSYGFTDARGIYRQVNYIADELGFRAKVMTNEPGTANENPADVIVQSTQKGMKQN